MLINLVISDPSIYPFYMPTYLLCSYALASQIPHVVSHKILNTKIAEPIDDLRTWTVRFNTI